MADKSLSVDHALRKAKSLANKGEHGQARQLYRAVLEKFPENKRAQQGLNSLAAPQPSPAQIESLTTLFKQGQLHEALEQGTALAGQYPNVPRIWNILGGVNAGSGRLDEAVACYTKALQIKPDYVAVYNNLGNVLVDLGRHEEAIASYTKALKITPDNAEVHSNLGNVFKALEKYEEAKASYTNALEIRPDFAEAHYNRGTVLDHLGEHEQAIASYTKAIQIKPDFAEAHCNIGNALVELKKPEEAITSYNRALQIKPDFAEVTGRKIYQQARICDWAGLASDGSTLDSSLAALGTKGTAITPFGLLSFEDNPERHRRRSEIYTAKNHNHAALPKIGRPQVMPDHIRIGYFSGDFQNHPVMHLVARLFELHDRSKFRVHAYSYGPNPSGDPMRARLEDGFDVFHDVRALSDREVAQLARDEGIDIAIDLTGYTTNSRTGILAFRAAPIQVNYLGYPGTLGAPFIDYIVADKFLIPEASQKFYSEKIVYLPDCFQPQDNIKPIAERTPARAELGLPERGFVFCCFNNTYKISPTVFDIWMRLLHQVDDSVLWLFKSNPAAEKNLLREAQDRGIDRARLIFADRVEHPEYLARYRVADLFLDTFNYNAGATASDALWAGLPVLTKSGQNYTARMAGSLLNALDMPELITTSEEAYKNLALDLATHPEKLQAIKEKLRAHRDTKPLFDTELFTQNLERAYRRVYDRYFDGAAPEHVTIGDQPK